MRTTGIILFLIFTCACQVQRHWMTVPLLPNESTLADLTQKDRPVVLLFLDHECPICQKYTKNIREYSNQYPLIQWVGVFTRWHSQEQIAAFRQTYNLDIPLYIDTNNRLIRKLGITTTPEVVFASGNGKVWYRGAIDNWFFGLGKHRPSATEHYLIYAIEAQSRGEAPKISRTTPIGCVIEQ